MKRDLRQLDVPPAQLLSSKPMDDPLESIMYITSVGVPSVVYETVKNLRQVRLGRFRLRPHLTVVLGHDALPSLQARGYRLGAMQRKFPALGIYLLYLLAFVELLAFPLLGAGSAGTRAHPVLYPDTSARDGAGGRPSCLGVGHAPASMRHRLS